MMNIEKEIIVYWAPSYLSDGIDWNLLYPEPQSLDTWLNKNLSEKLTGEEKKRNILICPAIKNLSKNTFNFKNPLHTKVKVTNGRVELLSKSGWLCNITHQPNLKDSYMMIYGNGFVFFCEEDLEMRISSPFFSNGNEHLKTSQIVPGKFNIGKWFRCVNAEFNVWSKDNIFEIKKDEDFLSISFETNKTVKLKRFEMTKKLWDINRAAGESSRWNPFSKLIDRYKMFTQTRTKDIVLKEIKKNLL